MAVNILRIDKERYQVDAIRIKFCYVNGPAQVYSPPHAKDKSPAANGQRAFLKRKMCQRLGLTR